jgi:perosamine synthetase
MRLRPDEGQLLMVHHTPNLPVIAKDPKLQPRMLLPRPGRRLDRYPFNDPSVRYFYLGRNAGYALTRVLGLQGKEILFPAWFDGPAVEAMRRAGATLGFYPVHEGAHIDPNQIRRAISPETGAVCLIHFAGFPGPVKEIREICRERSVKLIEDCAHALFSTLDGQPLGTFGDGALFSLYKWLPAPNGGMLTMRCGDASAIPDPTIPSLTSGVALSSFSLLDYLAMRYGSPGRVLRAGVRALGRATGHVAHLNYVGTGGIEFRDDRLLSDLLADVAPPLQGRLPDGVTPLFYPTCVTSKRAVLARLLEQGIEGRNFWEYSYPMLPTGLFPKVDELRQTVLELPIHQDVTAEQVAWMAEVVRGTLAETRRAPARQPPITFDRGGGASRLILPVGSFRAIGTEVTRPTG